MAIVTNEELRKVIFDSMATYINTDKKQIDKTKIDEAMNILEQITNLFNLNSKTYKNKSNYYSNKKGFADELYKITHAVDYPQVLHLITQFLDIIRGEPLELLVMEVTHDIEGKVSSIKTFKGKESEVELQRRMDKRFHKNTIEYLKDSLKEQIEMDQRFLKHYQCFENIAKSHFQHKSGKTGTRYNFNEGHIIEAYQRHLIEMYYDDNYDNRHISPKHVAIMLYYSINNTPWWQGGDVSNVQIKGQNYRLATEVSIRQVANVLIDLYQHPEKYTGEQIHNFFSESNQFMTLDELQKMTTNELSELFNK